MLGTTDYVSPEQALGHDVGPQSDLYSLGIVLYEMLTGDVPFHGENQVAVAMKHVREDLPDVQMRRPEVSSALAAVVDNATAKDLDQRYQDDAELIADLEDVLGIETQRSPNQATGEATAGAAHAARPARAGACRGASCTRRGSSPCSRSRGASPAVVLVFMATDKRAERGTGTRQRQAAARAASRCRSARAARRTSTRSAATASTRPRPRRSSTRTRTRRGRPSATTAASSTTSPASGIYVDAKPSVAARAIDVISPTRNWQGAIYAAPNGPPPTTLDGFTKLAPIDQTKTRTRVKLDPGGKRYRYYLVWITKLPPERLVGAAIAEIRAVRLGTADPRRRAAASARGSPLPSLRARADASRREPASRRGLAASAPLRGPWRGPGSSHDPRAAPRRAAPVPSSHGDRHPPR